MTSKNQDQSKEAIYSVIGSVILIAAIAAFGLGLSFLYPYLGVKGLIGLGLLSGSMSVILYGIKAYLKEVLR